jgi:polysaccharide pyruvyl transferase WcaK-like protein
MSVARILLLMDNRGDSNWGSQATTNALATLLQTRFPGAELRGLPRSACRPEGQIKRSLATWLVQKGSSWAVDTLSAPWRDQFEWADLVVVNGEGTLHPQPQALRWICTVTALAKRYSKPYWIVNSSLKCLGDPTQALFAEFFKGADHVAAREPVSFREMTALTPSAVQAADCAWLTELAPVEEARRILSKVGIDGRFAVMTGSASVHKWPIEHQRSVVKALWKRDISVVYMYSDNKDEGVAYRLEWAFNLGVRNLTHKEVTYRQLTTIQSLAEIVVGGRFHPTILAALVGTPFVAVPSNTHKMSGVMEMLGTPELLCDFSSLDQVIPTINQVLDNRDDWSLRLRERAQEIVPLAHHNVKT